MLTILIDSEDQNDKILGIPYGNFITSVLNYLEKLFATFEPPLLITVRDFYKFL